MIDSIFINLINLILIYSINELERSAWTMWNPVFSTEI